METEDTPGLIAKLSGFMGTTEPAIRLLLSLFAGYPLALIHRKYFYGKSESLQYTYFIITGLGLGLWNYGFDIFHSVFAVFFTFLTLVILGGSAASVAIIFVFNMIYLSIGYCYTATENYDINWTLPQCVLVLRLIAVAYDLYDGHQPQEKLSTENKKVALLRRPKFLEFFGFAFFPASFLVGPQFPLKRFQDFVSGNFSDDGNPGVPPSSCVQPAVKRFLQGVLYLLIFQAIGFFVTNEYIMSDEFQSLGFVTRCILLGVWGRYSLYKYISCWLLTEGACILFGLSYNGLDENRVVQWDGLANVDLWRLETATEFNHYIQSFNINTNHWVAQYIYKRLKFLGNRLISQAAALVFLAIWHGFHSGYYVCFLFEFMVIYMEKEVKPMIAKNEKLNNFFNGSPMNMLVYILLRIYTFVFMGWCLLPFVLLTFNRYWKVYGAVNYIGILLFGLWPVIYSPLLKLVLKKPRREQRED